MRAIGICGGIALQELIGRVLACLAEGAGTHATAPVCAVEPNTVVLWLVEAADQCKAFSRSYLCGGPRAPPTTRRVGAGKRNTQHIAHAPELRTRMKRLVRTTIGFSPSMRMHDIGIGVLVNRSACGRMVST